MSARTELKSLNWDALNPAQVDITAKLTNDMDLETVFGNYGSSSKIPRLADSPGKMGRKPNARAARGAAGRTSAAHAHSGGGWDVQRELLVSQIKRGEECLDQIRRDLAAVRADLEEWPAYERICGRNPLADYLQSISAKEQIVKFLPGWLKRQRQQLQNLNRKMESALHT